jgi:hypothetical protein
MTNSLHTVMTFSLVGLLGFVGCGGGGGAQPPAMTMDTPPMAGLNPPPVADGYQRFMTPPIMLKPGESEQFIYWVTDPLNEAMDVVDVQGAQTAIGHHATLLATDSIQPVGSSAPSTPGDTIKTITLGGITSAEGTNVNLPEGLLFRVPPGHALMVQAHYLNVTRKEAIGQSYVDVKLAKADPTRTVARSIVIGSTSFTIPAHSAATVDVHCNIQKDLRLVMASNHTHEHATVIFSEMTLPDGTSSTVKKNDPWSPEFTVNPDFRRFPIDQPLLIPKGTDFHLQCNWMNQTSTDLKFPQEMCGFLGFGMFEHDVICEELGWQEN